MKNNNKKWQEITNDQAYRLSMAEFKGATLQALQDLDKRVANMENYNQNTRLVSVAISGIAGLLGIFGIKTFK